MTKLVWSGGGILALFFLCVFMDRDVQGLYSISVNKHAKMNLASIQLSKTRDLSQYIF